eukprot:TRINITY_DN23043_c0_g1_i1.p1 TRINITY_DN23043_c0_g1~~TRINITY_DN23043_c0_g1_i1.p1  ORF type:complete len:403 (+),score=64.40 TRINITY_DN23043_c0_g1_i1:86-1294(+)
MTAKADAPRRRSVGFNYEGLSENACHKITQFTRRPPSDLICDIGRGVMKDGVRNDLCGHQYCRQCIVAMQKRSARCPVSGCGAMVGTLEPLAKTMATITNKLECICTNEEKGCEWRGTLGALELHMKTCSQFLPIRCEMCKQRVRREDMAQHAAETCPMLPAVCPHCGVSLLASELPAHLETCSAFLEKKQQQQEQPDSPARLSPSGPELEGVPRSASIEIDTMAASRAFSEGPTASPRKKFAREQHPNHITDSPRPPTPDAPEPGNARRGYSARLSGSSRRPIALVAPGEEGTGSFSPVRGGAGSWSPPSRPRQVSGDRGQLWAQIDDARSRLSDCGNPCSSSVCHETLTLLLSAVSSLQTRVTALESENDTLRLLSRRSPSMQFEHQSHSPPPTLAPLKR